MLAERTLPSRMTPRHRPRLTGTASVPSAATSVKSTAPEEKKFVIGASAVIWNAANVLVSDSVSSPASLSWRVRAAPPSVDCIEAMRARAAEPGMPMSGRRTGVRILRAALRAP